MKYDYSADYDDESSMIQKIGKRPKMGNDAKVRKPIDDVSKARKARAKEKNNAIKAMGRDIDFDEEDGEGDY